MTGADELRAHLLSLPEKARAELALELLESLSPTSQGDDEALLDEIEARIERAASGEIGATWDEVRARIEERYGK